MAQKRAQARRNGAGRIRMRPARGLVVPIAAGGRSDSTQWCGEYCAAAATCAQRKMRIKRLNSTDFVPATRAAC